MIDEHKRVFGISLAIVLVAAMAFLPVDHTISRGLVLGIALYFVYLLLLTKTVTMQLEAALKNRRSFFVGFLPRMVVLALPLAIAAKNPQSVNICAAFAPLFINHLVTYAIFSREERAA